MELKQNLSLPESVPLSSQLDSDSKEEKDERGHWSSEFEYVLSLIGYSVGLGNVWRFPYICSRNGGGAFLIPFLICLVLCGLPLFFLEVAIGQFSGKSLIQVWSLCPLMKAMGLGTVVMVCMITIFYNLVSAWSLYYTIFSCREHLPWTSCNNTWNTDSCVTSVKLLSDRSSGVTNNHTNASLSSPYQNISYTVNEWENETLSHTAAEEFWQYNALHITGGLGDVGSIRWELGLCLLGSWLLILICLIKGVKSVGKAVYITATLPGVILTVLLIRGLTLPGGPSGALFYITPDFSKLLNVQVWLEASLQVFYSLGPTWGGLITMSSFNKFHTNCFRNAIICTAVSEGTSLFAGLVVFSILGFMANEAEVPITDVVSSGPGLAFVIYPEALAQLPVPQLWSFVFFIMLIFLSLDSMFSLVEAVVCVILDQFPVLLKWRIPVTVAYCLCSCLVGLIFTTEGGMYIFQLVDWYITAIFPILSGCLECIVLGWVYGVERFSADIEMMIGKQVSVFFKITWCYITPMMLMVTFIFTLIQYKPPTYGQYVYPEYAAAIGWCIAFLPLVAMVFGMIIILFRKQGSLWQRLKQSLKPETSWGPSQVSYQELYQQNYVRDTSLRQTCIASVSCKS